MKSVATLTLEEAQAIIEAGIAKAREIDQPMNLAVVCPGGHLLAFARMEGAWLGSIDIAMSKAFTSRAFDLPTKEIGELAQPGKGFYGIQHSNEGKVSILPGGIPFKSGDDILGAIGVSGGTGKQDVEVAEACIEAFEQMFPVAKSA